MNDIELLDAYGPDAAPPSDAVLNAARARLLAENSPQPRRFLSRRVALAGLGLAMAVAVAGVTLPRLGYPPDPAPTATTTAAGPIRLVAARVPEFPYTLPGLGEASFTANPGDPVIAVYLADDGSDVYLTGTEKDFDKRFLGIGEHDVEVGDRPGRVIEPTGSSIDGNGLPRVLVWEHRPGEWLRLTGQGRYGTDEALIELAQRVEDKPQRLRFEVTVGLIPDGWELAAFKDESILMYRDPARPEIDFHVQWTPASGLIFRDEEVQGLQNQTRVTVQGRPADLFQAEEFWMVQARLADRSIVRIQTPRSFTAKQALEIAESVRRAG
ncbi:hypothetical protein FHR83_006435 [Actinoplanes campanulatus]|uniref:DUF4367 domain-containing protein n=1 Tax=Actinoplanes campanulatus TaxID=113559 RepID=A0A7W5AMB7_9ACTN|nr:hypothetical protein [Actinoplanes campanulatus]MBB3098736.1 hypothetical protein [Actinoplanes campanulatus]GGN37281.1 hypothetical protein GCM10010109_63100 [Actinoplanes campanulatus]GID40761.1 hypothetical protein Aca09nite_72670 [Actinoplanes campanulatus]